MVIFRNPLQFAFVLDNVETRLSISDNNTKIIFKIGVDEGMSLNVDCSVVSFLPHG